MGRKPGIPNKPKSTNSVSRADAIMAVVHDLTDQEIQAALFMRSMERLNSKGKIEVCRYLISLYEAPLKYVGSWATMADCENAINGLNKIINDLQREQEERKEEQEVNADDEVHQ